MSGPAALDIAAPLIALCRGLAGLESHRLTRVTLVDPGSRAVLDDALCAVMRAPRSYTGEDMVEISCHGNPALARMLLQHLVDSGARLAEPGEFTRRAFVNGKLDLAQAEAVAILIRARTERAVALAARGVAGDLSRKVRTLRDGLIEVIASLEVSLDFPDDVDEPDRTEMCRKIKYLRDESAGILSAARRGLVTHAGLTVAIVGAPNAGKSSLFNALLGRERAIVTPEAGTTRDVLEGAIALSGVPIRLLDTAGIGRPRDPIDAEAMERSRRAIQESDFLVLVVDASRAPETPPDEELLGRPRVIVLAKSDLGLHPSGASAGGAVLASVKVEGGLDALLDRLSREVEEQVGNVACGDALSASMRQVELLSALATALGRAFELLDGDPTEIALIDLRGALDSASELLGLEVGEAVLDAIFSRFCVGK